MGKHNKERNGGGGQFAAYMAALGNEGGADGDDTPFPESMRASTLLEQIGKERSWEDDMVEADIEVCERNRLFLVRDLRLLSDESWKEIQLLPIVKDLLRVSIYRGMKTKKDRKKEKKYKEYKEKKEKKEKREKKEKKDKHLPNDTPKPLATESAPTEETLSSKPTNGSIIPIVEYKSESAPKATKEESSASSSSSSSSYSDSESEPELEPASVKTGTGPRLQPISPTRIKVTTTSGTAYECDRLCPHKGVDLMKWGTLSGNTLVCTKHNWAFNLGAGGGRSGGGRGVNACKVNDW